MLAASFPRAGQGFLAWAAFVPLLVFIALCRGPRQAFAGGLFAAAVWTFILLIWIPPVLANYGGLPWALTWVAYGLMTTVLACYPALACAAVKFLMKRRGDAMLLLFPLFWVVAEYVVTYFPFGGFPWLLAGYSQSGRLALMQAADLAGVYGVSFMVLWANASLAWIFLRRRRGAGLWGPSSAAVALIAAAWIYGDASLRRWEGVERNYEAAMLQGDIAFEDPEPVMADKFKNGYVRMADSLGPAPVDLLVLPESPTPVSFQFDSSYQRTLEDLARRYPLGLIFNNIRFAGGAGEDRYYNSAYFLDRNGNLAGVYDKIHLVPFGEYIPLKGILPFTETISKDVGEFSPGRDYRVVKMGDHAAGAVICYEAVFPALVRRFAREGSGLIINVTNDRWYGASAAPYQHLAIARWRAVENRRFMLRAANSGISAVIEPSGRIQSSTGLLRTAVCRGRFAFLEGQTFYTRHGDVFVFLCAIIVAGMVVVAARGR
jgi:apolipoprotein N-acyltransferase